MKPKTRNKLIFLAIAAIAAFIIIIVDTQGLFSLEPSVFVFAADREVSFGGRGAVFVADNGFFVSTNESVRFFDNRGREIFRHGITMIHPALIGRGNYAAVAEQGGQALVILNQHSHLYTIRTQAPIVSFAVSHQGLAAVIAFDGINYAISVYSPQGLIHSADTGHFSSTFIPAAIDISNDGRFLAISYLDIGDAQMNSVVQFISLDDGGVFAMTAANHERFIGVIRFMDDNRLLTISDRCISLINPYSRAEVLWEIELNNRIASAEFGGNWFAIAYADELLNHSGRPANTIVVYNLHRQEIFTYSSPRSITSLSSKNGSLILGANHHFTALSPSGDTIWQHIAPNNVTALHFLDDADTALAVSPTNAVILHRTQANE